MNSCCNPFETPAWVSDMIQSVINQKIICNEIQAGLLDCEGGVLAPGTHMVRCEELSGLVDEAIKNGDIDIPGIESLEFDGERITLVDQAGKTHQIDVSELAPQSITSNGFEIILTMKNGQEYKVDLEAAVEEAIVRKAVKSAVLTKDNTLEMTLGDGSKITANLGKLLQEVRVTNGSVDSEGNIQIVLGDGTVVPINAKRLREVVIERDSALVGNGDDIPLDIDFSRVCWQVIESITMDGDGLHIKIDNQCDAVTLPIKDIAGALKDKVAVCVASTGYITGNGTSGNCLDLDLQKIIDALVKDEKVLGTLINNLHYKIKVKTDGTLKGDGTEKSPLGVQLSPDAGNLLTARENGLYYGQQAAADLSNLYVDSATGDDKNPGTKSLPLKTLGKAMSMVRSDQSNTIHLRAGGVYSVPNNQVTGGATRTITVYGDPYVDGSMVQPATPQKPSYTWMLRDKVNRPKLYLTFGYNANLHVFYNSAIGATNGGKLLIRGCELHLRGLNEPGTGSENPDFDPTWGWWDHLGMFSGNSSGIVELWGCKVKTYERPLAAINIGEDEDPEDEKFKGQSWRHLFRFDADGNGPTVRLIACNSMNVSAGEEKLASAILALNGAVAQVEVRGRGDSWSQEPDYEYLDMNMGAALKVANAVTGVVRDTNGTPRNVTSNIIL